MKRLVKIFKYLFLCLIGLFSITIVGLLIFYQSLYSITPPAPQVDVVQYLSSSPPFDEKPTLLPVPKKLIWLPGNFGLTNAVRFSAPHGDADVIKKLLISRLHWNASLTVNGNMSFIKNESIAEQGYLLSIQPSQIKIEYHDHAGLFYALTTLKQLATQSINHLPGLQIEDNPDLKVRGAMLDVSRGKVPTLETLYQMVDFLADLKYNHLQLYVEGFSFGYPSFKTLWEKTETPLLPEEIRLLDAYCKDRFIELVPNQNSLGHMAAWLATDQFKELAECPEGYKLLGLIETTLSPTNPKSLELVEHMSRDLLPNFTSKKFNVNLDEPFELGKCNKRKIENPTDVARLYLTYAEELNRFAQAGGKTMMMWGDVVSRSPEIISSIPKNITLLEWGYESFHPFKKICPQYQRAGLHYLVCPGTSSWSSFTGRTNNMIVNVDNAVSNAIQFGADGILMTDWGDTPHLQYLTVSYAGFAYAAALSWDIESKNNLSISSYLNKIVFQDSSNKMAEIVMNLGTYNQFEEFPMISGTTTSMAYRFGLIDKAIVEAVNKKMQKGIFELLPYDEETKAILINNFTHPKVYNAKAILDFTSVLCGRLKDVHLHRADSNVILAEYQNAIRMIQLGAKLKQYNNYHMEQNENENKERLSDMQVLCDSIIQTHKRLWMIRNKRSGLDGSLDSFHKLRNQINEQLDVLESSGFIRWEKRKVEEIFSAAAVLYLR